MPMFQADDKPVDGTGTALNSLAAKPKSVGASGADEAEQLIITLRLATGEIEKVEKLDSGGKLREVPTDEAFELAGTDDMKGIETALDDAFEAGIVSMLDPESDAEESHGSDQSTEDLELRRELLTLIIGSEVRRRLLRRIAGRIILNKRIESKG
jgi:hypothetical protein